MRLSGLTGPHLARLSSNRKGRLATPVEKSHASDGGHVLYSVLTFRMIVISAIESSDR
jgi:hypothetical protein